MTSYAISIFFESYMYVRDHDLKQIKSIFQTVFMLALKVSLVMEITSCKTQILTCVFKLSNLDLALLF